jgi:hypothetical protein
LVGTDHAFKIIALPGKMRQSNIAPDSCCRNCLENPHNFTQRRGAIYRALVGRALNAICGCGQGRNSLRPYGIGLCFGDLDDDVNVIGHHDKNVNLDGGKTLRQGLQNLEHDASSFIQNDLRFLNATQQELLFVNADGHEVRTWTRVIVVFQSDGLAMVFIRIELDTTYHKYAP